MLLKNTMKSERSLAKILHIAWLHLYEMSRTGTSIETVDYCLLRVTDCEQRATIHGHMVYFGNDKPVLELDCGALCEFT